MVTIKSFSDLQQSKKLAKILPLESADMIYPSDFDFPFVWIEKPKKDKDATPCWSLAALLSVLPQSINIESERCQKTFHLNFFRSYYHCCSYSFGFSISDDDGDNTLYCIGRDNWVDACVAMIEKLHELNLL